MNVTTSYALIKKEYCIPRKQIYANIKWKSKKYCTWFLFAICLENK